MIGIEAGQEVDNFQIILEGMIEVVLGQDQVQEQVSIETELDTLNVGNTTILLRIAPNITVTEKHQTEQM